MTFPAFAESIQLVPDGTIFIHIFIILAMVFILNRILYRPLAEVLKKRDEHTRGRSGEAREIIRRIEDRVTHYERTRREARAEGYHLMEQQQGEAFKRRQDKISLVKNELNQQLENEKEGIRAQMREARRVLENEIQQIAANISAGVLRR